MVLYRRPYRDRHGRRRLTRTWSYRFEVRGQVYEGSTGLTDRRAAAAEEKRLHKLAERAAAGMAVDLEEITLAEAAADYAADLVRRGRSSSHVAGVLGDLARLDALLGGGERSVALGTLTPQAIGEALGKLTGRAPSKDAPPPPASGRTQNKHLGSLHALLRWLGLEGRENPARAVGKAREIHRRARPFTPAEVAALLAAEPAHRVEAWRRRRLVYLLAVATGIRKGTLRLLERRDLDLQAGVLYVDAARLKSRRDLAQPLPAWAVRELRPALAGAAPDARPFAVTITTATWLRDLERAGVERDTVRGRVDFHSLRRSYNDWLADRGVELSQRQRLMQHGDPALTSNTYTFGDLDRDRRAVDLLPDVTSGPASGAQAEAG